MSFSILLKVILFSDIELDLGNSIKNEVFSLLWRAMHHSLYFRANTYFLYLITFQSIGIKDQKSLALMCFTTKIALLLSGVLRKNALFTTR